MTTPPASAPFRADPRLQTFLQGLTEEEAQRQLTRCIADGLITRAEVAQAVAAIAKNRP